MVIIKSSDVIRLGKSSDVVHRGKMSKNESRIYGECLKEAFWSRAMPSATVAGASIYWAVRAGKLKSLGKSRFRTWSAVAGFSGLTLLVGEFSYLFGKNCSDKFLIKAPECSRSKLIRKTRNIIKLRKVDSLFFDERKMTDKEKQILIDCNSTAFYQFSLPAMVVASATSFFGVARSPWLQNRSRMAQLAPVALACLLGYYMGLLIYLNRRECPDSFVKHAPEGSIAKILQRHRDAPQDYELFEGSQTVALVENEMDEVKNEKDELENDKDVYVIPASAQLYLNKLVNETQPSPIQQTTSASITK